MVEGVFITLLESNQAKSNLVRVVGRKDDSRQASHGAARGCQLHLG